MDVHEQNDENRSLMKYPSYIHACQNLGWKIRTRLESGEMAFENRTPSQRVTEGQCFAFVSWVKIYKGNRKLF